MSYKIEVELPRGEKSSNQQRFATEAEAKAAGDELLSRWMVPISSKPVATPLDLVNYRFNFEVGRSEMLP